MKRKGSDTKMDNKEELLKRLTPLQYEVTQNEATERPFPASTMIFMKGHLCGCREWRTIVQFCRQI